MKIDRDAIRRLAGLGILSALGVLAAGFIQFPIIPGINYLKYDPADVFLLIGGFLYGPIWGLAPVFITAVLQELFFGSSGWIGALMHFVASGALVTVSAAVYSTKKSRSRAIVALACGAASMIAVMIPLNLVFTPMYTGMQRSEVAKLIIPAILPFNAIKACGNSIITLVLYKRTSKLFKNSSKALPSSKS